MWQFFARVSNAVSVHAIPAGIAASVVALLLVGGARVALGVEASPADQALSFRPARMLFFDSLNAKSNSYNLIASLPSVHHWQSLDDHALGVALHDGQESVFSPGSQLSWLHWSSESYGLAMGSDYRGEIAKERSSEFLTPFAVSFFFQPNRLIFVPSYQYGVSRSEASGDETTSGYLDLYMLYLSATGARWLSIDPAVQRDFETRRTTYSFEFEAGHVISSVFGDGGVYARPGVEIADDRPYDWNLEVGIRLNY